MHLEDLEDDWDEQLTPITERDPSTSLQQEWAEHGFIVTRDVLPEDKLVAYEREWWAYNGNPESMLTHAGAPFGRPQEWRRPGGWPDATPYMRHDALRALVCDGALAAILQELTGEPMGVHLNLTGWVSTRRDWHRDQYLNEKYVGDFYTAVWIALDDIHEDAGPFEFIPGSHKGRPLSQEKMKQALEPHERGPDWPTHSERILTPLFEDIVRPARKSGRVKQFIAQRGDILIWHGRLLHRGSVPNDVTRPRRALIAHYSGVNHRPDMPLAVRHTSGGWFFPLQGRTPSSYKQEAIHA